MLFFKYYDVKNNFLTYCGHGHYLKDMPFQDLLPTLCDMAGLPIGTSLAVYEEEYMNCITMITDMSQPLGTAINELMDGDIIVFQRDDEREKMSVKDYFNDLLHRVEVMFCDKNNPNDPGFTIELSLKMNYNQIANAVSMRLGIDPFMIQFFKNQRYCYQTILFLIFLFNSIHIMQFFTAVTEKDRAAPFDVISRVH